MYNIYIIYYIPKHILLYYLPILTSINRFKGCIIPISLWFITIDPSIHTGYRSTIGGGKGGGKGRGERKGRRESERKVRGEREEGK